MYESDIYSVNNESSTSQGVYSGYSQPQYTGAPAPETKVKKEHPLLKKIAVAALTGVLFGACAGGTLYGLYAAGIIDFTKEVEVPVTKELTGPEIRRALEQEGYTFAPGKNNIELIQSSVSDVVSDVMPAMVSIVNNYTVVSSWFGQRFSQEASSSGSGIILSLDDDELLIATNYHVINQAEELIVTFTDDTEANAKVKGVDSGMDLAVIAVNVSDLSKETLNAISIAKIGNSDSLRLGEDVIAVGNALGYGQSVTNGIVSALNREIELEDGSTGTFIQTNAAINPGNSGGALLNMKGEVVGINSNKIGGTTVEGMGFAIPISSASPILSELLERETRDKVADEDRGYLGIAVNDISESAASMYGMPVGVYISEVYEDMSADKAGLLKGDIITKFDGSSITTYDDLIQMLSFYSIGDEATVTYQRMENGEYVEHTTQVVLGKKVG